MKLETQFLEDHQAKLVVEVEDERLESTKHRAAHKLARRVKIPGFRPGKAPYPVILRTVGEAAVFEEALEMLVDEIYPEAVKEADIKPYGPGRLDNVAKNEPLTLEFVVPLDAEVKPGDYKSVRLPYEPKPVPDEDVDKSLESLRANQAVIEPVERPAEEGDVVTVLLNGKTVEDEKETEIVKERSVPLIIKSDDEDEWPFPGFSAQLIGKSAGDEGSSEYTYPGDYSEEILRSKKALFAYKVENVKSRTLPELNDDFATSVGEFETLGDLRANVRTALESQADQEYNATYDEKVLDELIEQSEFKYPPQMLEEEINHVVQDLQSRLERQGLDLDIYLKSRDMDEKAFREEVRPTAEKRLKRNLLIYELGRMEDIQVEREELESEANSTLNYLQRILPEKDARRLSNRDIQNNVVNNVMVDILSRKTVERLRDIASGKREEELLKEQDQSQGTTGEVQDTAEADAVEPDQPVEEPAPEIAPTINAESEIEEEDKAITSEGIDEGE